MASVMKDFEGTSSLYGANAPYVEELYERYLADPASVDGTWRALFDGWQKGGNGKDVAHTPVIEAFQRLAKVATKAGVEGEEFRIHAPLLRLKKAEIVRRGVELGLDLGMTRSCYDLDHWGRACGHCDSCLLRRRGFEEAGIPDPTEYQ